MKPSDAPFVFPSPFGWRTLASCMGVMLLLWLAAKPIELSRLAGFVGEAGEAVLVGKPQQSQVLRGFVLVLQDMIPLQIEERTPLADLPMIDRARLPFLTRIEVETQTRSEFDPATLQSVEIVVTREVLVHPLGYVSRAGALMLQTSAMALWGTTLAFVASMPFAFFAARNLAPHRIVYWASRVSISGLRSIPELVLALVFVIAFGFGPIAGVLALALHSVGFLAKFIADDVEASDPNAWEALRATGASRLQALRFAIVPQIAPQVVAYCGYLLDRNMRMASVVGLVGAGGIGQELKGRFDTFEYGHMATLMLFMFAAVFLLDAASAQIRKRWLQRDPGVG